MSLAALKTELDAGHPDTGAYDPDSTIAWQQINAVNRTRYVPIPSTELLAWAASGDRMKNIEAAASDMNHVVHGPAKAALLLIERDGTHLDLGLADRMALVDGLVAAGVLTAADKTSLVDLGTETVSRAAELGLGDVRVGAVTEARQYT